MGFMMTHFWNAGLVFFNWRMYCSDILLHYR